MRIPQLGLQLILYFLLVCFADGKAQTVDAYLDKAKSFNNSSVDSAMVYVEKAKSLALDKQDTLKLAEVNNLSAYVLLLNGQHDRAIEELSFNQEALPNSAHLLLSETHYNLGSAYYLKEVYDNAIEHYLSSIEHFEVVKDKSGLAKANLQVGVIYEKSNKIELANYFYDRSIASSKSSLRAHPTTGNSQPRSSLENVVLSTIMLEELGDTPSITKSFVYYNIGLNLKDAGRCESAIQQFRISLSIKKKLSYRSNIGKSHLLIAECLISLERELEALDELYQAKTYSNERKLIQEIEQLTARAYSGLGNTEQAFAAYIRYTNIKDSVANLAENERIAEITSQFETEKQAQEIELLTADNQLFEARLSQQRLTIVGIVLMVALVSLVLYLYYLRIHTKRQLEFSEVNRQLLQTQLNPHFLFNALGGIKHVIAGNDSKASTAYIQNFSSLMRNILENTTEKFIPLEEDIETITDYLALQQLVYNHGFNYTVEVDSKIETDLLQLPPMFTQPFVENAVIHGMKGVDNGQINVVYRQNSEVLEVSVTDNGPGIRTNDQHANSMHKSMATSIIKKRKEYLAKTQKYHIEILTKNSDLGVEVLLKFPVKLPPN